MTESLHTSVQRFNLGQIAAANPYGTALGLNPVFTLAAQFISSCPADNPALPVMAFPALTATQGVPAAAGMMFTFTANGTVPDAFFVVFVSGLETTSVSGNLVMMEEGAGGMISATIPPTAMGQTYVFVSAAETNGTIMDEMVLFGPAVVEVTPAAPVFVPDE